MSQVTNLNVSPYFDDFNAADNYHRVLFKPGYPVQARELTNLQSILQNQIERFGQHFFKEGAKVIPGNTAYTRNYYGVELTNTYQGVPVDAYVDQLLGIKITGQTSGITAVVDNVLVSSDSERGNTTLYVNYLASSSQDNNTQQFLDGEALTAESAILSGLLGNSTIPAGETFAITTADSASSIGSAFSIVNGVYFIRGQFVTVDDETLILDQYTNTPSYRIGLYINEQIITADQDETLTDNATGYNNYAAPGADRLQISASLFKKALSDKNDANFVELAVVENGILRSKKETDQYAIVSDELARRTYAESGDYITKPFDVTVKDSLNNGMGNNGVLEEGQLTSAGSPVTEDLAVYQVSPGKAFVKGYEIETITSLNVDCPKPREVKTIENEAVFYNTGSTLKLNRVFGTPLVGIGNTYVLSLRDRPVGAAQTTPAGNEIGVARVYDFRLESGSYSTTNENLNEWDVSLFDVQTTTKITLNENVTLTTPVIIEGQNSGAVGYLKDSISDTNVIDVYDKTGTFMLNEEFEFNGIGTNRRVATAITSFGLSDVTSVHGNIGGVVGVGTTFSADVIQHNKFTVGVVTFTGVDNNGISTAYSQSVGFPNRLYEGNLLEFPLITYLSGGALVAGDRYPTWRVRVVSVGSSTITVTGVTSVTDLYNGGIPSLPFQVSDLKVLQSNLDDSIDRTLYTSLPRKNVSNVDLEDSYVIIRKSVTVTISGNQLGSPVVAGTNETFMPYDEERYSLIRSDGTTEVLTKDKFGFSGASTSLQIYNLGANDGAARLTYTLKKSKPTAKKKLKNRVNSVIIDKSKLDASGTGEGTLKDGLTWGDYPYGTRVQDKRISLNVPDVITILGVYESVDTTEASAPTVIFSNISGASASTEDFIIGEKFTGQNTGAIGMVAQKLTDSQIQFIPLNSYDFREGEIVKFEESKIQASVSNLASSSFNISREFKFNPGQRGTFYDYGSIIRRDGFDAPLKQIKVYFSNGYYESTDLGDITTVNSYDNGFNYTNDIKVVNGERVSDIIDIRPSVNNYTVTESARSPFEFYGRTFDQSGNSAPNILASDESLNFTYSFYLPRIDRLFLTKDGKFQVQYGDPSENPEPPVSVDNAIELATIDLPPYLFHPSQADVDFLEHKRYRMVDIRQLEKRIKNLEYYTSLSLLETNTANMFVPDSQGLNRFKSGFFVDNFASVRVQQRPDEELPFKNSVDIKNKILKPQHYTNAIDLVEGPESGWDNKDDTLDSAFTQPEGINIRKTEGIVTLDYAEVPWLTQSFATRTESVTPFLVSFWQGALELTPATDTWIDTARLEAKIIKAEGDYKETMREMVENNGVDPQTGFGPTIWNSWETNWTGQEVIERKQLRTHRGGQSRTVQGPGGRARVSVSRRQVRDFVEEDTLREVRDTGTRSRTGNRAIVTEQWDNTSVGDRTVSRDAIPFMRSRNIQFINKKVKPLTRMYAFFDGKNVTKFCVPKLLEIEMESGTFEVGEDVTGTIVTEQWGSPAILVSIKFRAAQANHRAGEYNIPTETYIRNPYTSQLLSESYSSTSNILNVDTFSLQEQAKGEYFGYVEAGMKLYGQRSGAWATITDVKLVSDISANLSGSFFIPDPNVQSNPRFEAGTKVLTFVNDPQNNQEIATTISEEGFTASGTLETVQENIISVRNARIQNKIEFEEHAVNRTTGMQVISTRVISETRRNITITMYYDPLAQSFLVDETDGIFVTRCDLFFRSKDDADIPVTIQLRTMKGGFPTQKILPFSEIIMNPDEINVSGDGSVATPVNFKAPVYLEGNNEYAICVASNSTKYSVYISRIGENDLLTDAFISNQPYLGSLFKSQNASTWEPSQWEDLKFVLYRADFVEQGQIEFYNPALSQGNKQIPTLMPNSLEMTSRTIRVGLTTTLNDPDLKPGNVISQLGNNATGVYVGAAGSVTGALNVINSGIGYTGPFTYTGVAVTTITGFGRNATADIQVAIDGTVGFATIVAGGTGYEVGDTLGVTTIGTNNLGTALRLSVASIGSTSELVLEKVQGNFITVGTASTLQFTNSSGITSTVNYANGASPYVNINSGLEGSDGLHIKVNHKNHGMYSDANQVILYDVQSDVLPTRLNTDWDPTSGGGLSVESTDNFQSFENVGVGTTNSGYLKIGNTIVGYTTASGTTINGVTIISGDEKTYPTGTYISKYEMNGVSLRRINGVTHNLSDATVANPITFDSYNIKVGMSTNGVDRTASAGWPKLYTQNTKSAGGSNIKATQNMPYEIITPMVANTTVPGTTLTGMIKTVSGKSISGNEIPFIDKGWETIALNKQNYMDSPRVICSEVNQNNKLTTLPGKKSFQLSIQLASNNTMVSPTIDTQRVYNVLTSSRVNNIIGDYALDKRACSMTDDPTAFQYISKEITLENSATSLRVMMNVAMNPHTDIRAFYAISEDQNFDPVFTPFPGYNNINDRGEMIKLQDSDGLPDAYVPIQTVTSAEESMWSEYTFSSSELPTFKSYRIKFLLTSTSQVYTPSVKELRVIALA